LRPLPTALSIRPWSPCACASRHHPLSTALCLSRWVTDAFSKGREQEPAAGAAWLTRPPHRQQITQ
jgi:hypothetical protein